MDSTFEIIKEVVGIEVSPSIKLRKEEEGGRRHTKLKGVNAMIVNFTHGGMVSMR